MGANLLEVKLLGQFEARQDGKSVEIPARPAQVLLAYLLLNPGTTLRREKLAGLLWPDATEANARNNLRNALWRLRQALGPEPDYILADNFSVTFAAGVRYELDVAILQSADSTSAAADDLIAQVSVYRGELLPGFYEDWVVLERDRLQTVFEGKLGRLLERLVEARRWPEVLDWGERWIGLGTAPEPAFRALMVAQAELGDRSRMATVYGRCVAALRDQLAVEPSAQTRALFERLSHGEMPTFNSPSVPAAGPAPMTVRADEPPSPGEPPFKGLQFFDEADAGLFFGREELTARLVDQLRQHRCLAVVGASGSGKSSIVRAGLIPALKSAGSIAAAQGTPQARPAFIVHLMTPTAHPLEALAVSLTLEAESVTATATLIDDLAQDARSLRLAGRRVVSRMADAWLVLVVDQFEELFTLCHEESERAAFVDNLMTAVEASGPTLVIITLRADFYAHCAGYPRLRAFLEQFQAYIGPMSAAELRRAIEAPALAGGWEFEPGLIDLLLHDVGVEPGALPLLSHALLETWRRRRGRELTLGGYAASGGVRGAIAKTAESVIQGMSPAEQAIARNIFLRLTELGEGTQDTRRRAALTEILDGQSDDPAQRAATDAVLKTLADARLITITEATVEVAHEALIREWPTLREWLNENREGLRLRRHMTEAAQAWAKLARDPGELYRGARLAQALELGKWSQPHWGNLTTLEREFLLASQALAEHETAEREAQRQRELEAARELNEFQQRRAAEQTRAAARLRARNRVVMVFGVAAGVLAVAALYFALQARQQTNIAISRQLAAQGLAVSGDKFDLAALLSLEALRFADTGEARSAMLSSLQVHPNLLRQLHGHRGVVNGLAFSPDGTILASGGQDATIRLWNVATGQSLGPPLTGHIGNVNSLAFSPDGKTLASSSQDGTVRLWDVTTHRPIGPAITGTGGPIASVTFSPDGKTLAFANLDGSAMVLSVKTGQPTGPQLPTSAGVASVAFSPLGDGKTLATGNGDGTVVMWDVATGRPIDPPLFGHTDWVISLAFSPDGKTLASASRDGTVRLWDITTRAPILPPLFGHTNWVNSVAFSPDGKTLASASRDGTLRLWEVATSQQIGAPLTGHPGWVGSVAFSPDGKTMASGHEDGTILFWGLATRPALTTHAGSVNGVAFSPDGKILASGTFGGALVLWDAVTRQPLGPPLIGHTGSVNSLAFSPDGKTIVTSGDDHTLLQWNVATRRALGPPLTGHADRVTSAGFSPDGKLIASGSADLSIILWDAATQRPLGPPLTGHTGSVNSVAFSPDGKTLLSGSQDATLRLWDVATRRPLGAPLVGHIGGVTSVAFSPDGKTLASGGYDDTLILWDVATRQPLGSALKGHSDWVYSVTFSPDGKSLASASRDGTLRLWDVATRQPIGQPFSGHGSSVNSVAFSPDSESLASGSSDSTVLLWDVSAASWQTRACNLAGRNLSLAEWDQYVSGQPYHQTCAQWPTGQ